MSEAADKLCRAILYQVKNAKSLKEAVRAVEVAVGAENVAFVNEMITKAREEDK